MALKFGTVATEEASIVVLSKLAVIGTKVPETIYKNINLSNISDSLGQR